LIILDENILDGQLAAFIRRFPRHPDFDTISKRAGTMVRASPPGLAFWRLRVQKDAQARWARTG